MNVKLSPLEREVLKYIKEHKIKNNQILARILMTNPHVIATIKYRLIKKGVLKPEEARERNYTRRKTNKTETEIKKEKTISKNKKEMDILDFLMKRNKG